MLGMRGGRIMQRRAGYVTAGAIVGTLLAYRKDLKQLEFDLASATGKELEGVQRQVASLRR